MELTSIIEMLLAKYLQDDLWKLCISNDHSLLSKPHHQQSVSLSLVSTEETPTPSYSNQQLPFETLNSNIQLTCLLLEGIAIFSEVLKTNFNVLLIQALYPVLEKVGSTNASISQAALNTLINISRHCNYNDVEDLILVNSDYLINSITMQFRHLVYDSAAPAVLCVIIKFCNKDLVPIISDAIEDVFNALDNYQEEVAENMLNVLDCVAVAVNKWYNGDGQENEKTNCSQKQTVSEFITDQLL